jgi:hypothetical protein
MMVCYKKGEEEEYDKSVHSSQQRASSAARRSVRVAREQTVLVSHLVSPPPQTFRFFSNFPLFSAGTSLSRVLKHKNLENR